MSGVIVDTSVWIDCFAGRSTSAIEDALAQGVVVLPPVVVAELVSGAKRPKDRAAIADLMREIPIYETPLAHWIRVGELRRYLKDKGLTVSTPDAHVAQCALDRDALLLSRDAIFQRIARVSRLRVKSG